MTSAMDDEGRFRPGILQAVAQSSVAPILALQRESI